MDENISGLSSLQKVDLDYLEAPPQFAFEKKLDLVKDTSNLSGIVKDDNDDDASSAATPLEVAFGDRSWSWLSAGSQKQQQSPILTHRSSQLPMPPDLHGRGENKDSLDMDTSSRSVKDTEDTDMNIDRFANKVPPALWTQMKKLESLQNPFHDKNRAELKASSQRQQKRIKDATLDRVAAAMKKLEALQNPLEESDGVVLIFSLESIMDAYNVKYHRHLMSSFRVLWMHHIARKIKWLLKGVGSLESLKI